MTTEELKALAGRVEHLLPSIEKDGWLTFARITRWFIHEATALAEQRDSLTLGREVDWQALDSAVRIYVGMACSEIPGWRKDAVKYFTYGARGEEYPTPQHHDPAYFVLARSAYAAGDQWHRMSSMIPTPDQQENAG